MLRQYRIRPLSEYGGEEPPAPAPVYQFPAWDETRANSTGFISYLNFILQFAPPVASEKAAFDRFARIGIGPGRAFDGATLDPATRDAIETGIKEGKAKLQAAIDATTSSVNLFRTREFLGTDYVMHRAVGWASTAIPRRRPTTRRTPLMQESSRWTEAEATSCISPRSKCRRSASSSR